LVEPQTEKQFKKGGGDFIGEEARDGKRRLVGKDN